MVQVEALVAKVAPTPATVLVTGESGTGKEVVARLIHQKSPRAPGPFVAINLGGIPETLIESELFGHEKGAFTGAVDRKKGIFELASAGTLFLDEIGDLPLHLQVKLLRVLQDRQVQRVGGTQLLPMDARIIAATNRPLEALIKENKFREDLYYRINVIRIELPPLRDRKADIPHLADLFVQRLNRELGRRIRGFTAEALDRLQNYPFPGNVRELENLVERACILSESDLIGPETLGDLGPKGENPARSVPGSPEGGLRKAEQEAIRQALARHSGNLAAVAAELGISVRTLYTKRKELDQNDS
jgi:two-component system response regulator AtoC